MKKNKIIHSVIAALLSVILIAVDQLTKIIAFESLKKAPFVIIEGVFELRYTSNYGAAWGILSGQRLFFIIVTMIICVVIAVLFVMTPHIKKYIPLMCCELLAFSGAIGNFIDRVILGYVRDFLYFSLIDFPIFNIADCYVVISAIFLCILVLFVYKDEDFEFLKKDKKDCL